MAKTVQTFIADVNGDGTPDFVILDSDHRWSVVNGATGRTDDIPQLSAEIPGWPSSGRYFLADFTGDGIVDRAYLNSDGKWFVAKGVNGSPGVPGIPWGSSIPGWPGDGRYVIADFTGDGIANRCYISPDGKWFVVDSNGSPGVPGIPWGSSIPGWPGDGHFMFADFTGDGITNRCYINPDGKWFVVDSNGSPGVSGIPWGSSIPGWPGGGRYLCFDFNGDGVADRCYVHPKGRVYVVNSTSGAPMDNVPELGNWGDKIPTALDFAFDLMMFGIAGGGCIATKDFRACVAAIGAAKAIVDDIIGFVEEKKNIQHKVIKKRRPNYDPLEEPFDRPWHPKHQPDVGGGTSEAQPTEKIEVMTISGEDGQAIELDVSDYEISAPNRENFPE